jgi:hypothetical protein
MALGGVDIILKASCLSLNLHLCEGECGRVTQGYVVNLGGLRKVEHGENAGRYSK